MKKKTFLTLLPLFIVAVLCMTLTSCSGGDDSDNLVPPTPTNNGGSGDASGAGGSNGYEPSVAPGGAQAIDLGLPSGTLWANMNVGATTAEGAGLYFAWGETMGYGNNTSDGRLFDGNSYKYASESYPYVLKYCTQSENGTVDNKTMLELADDAARANWKGNWRMPTRDEFQELLDNTTQERTTQNGVSGIKLTSKKNGNSIFFPAIGYRLTDEMMLYGEGAWYWTSSLEYDDSNRNYMDYCATAFGFGRNSTLSKTYDGRTYGLNVRAVIGKTGSQPDENEDVENGTKEPLVKISMISRDGMSIYLQFDVADEVDYFKYGKVGSYTFTERTEKSYKINFTDLYPGEEYSFYIKAYDKNNKELESVTNKYRTISPPYTSFVCYRGEFYAVTDGSMTKQYGNSGTGTGTNWKYLRLKNYDDVIVQFTYGVHEWEGISSTWSSGYYSINDDGSYYQYNGWFNDGKHYHGFSKGDLTIKNNGGSTTIIEFDCEEQELGWRIVGHVEGSIN